MQKKVYAVWRKYLSETSLHGLKYFNAPGERALEKAFWMVAVLGCWGCAGWWSYEVKHGRQCKKGAQCRVPNSHEVVVNVDTRSCKSGSRYHIVSNIT